MHHMHPVLKVRSLLILAACATAVACSQANRTPSPPPPPESTSRSDATAQPATSSTVQPASQSTDTPAPRAPGGAPGGIIAIPVKQAARVPADVPEHLSLMLGGGAGSDCSDIDTAPVGGGTAPRQANNLAGFYTWCYCQLDEPEASLVTATLTLADGARELLPSEVYAFAEQGACVDFWYSFKVYPSRAPHAFSVNLSGRAVVDVFVPLVGEFVFDGFQPNERVRVILYAQFEEDGEPVFVADEHTQADGDGRLIVQSAGSAGEPLRRTTVYAVGQKTGCRMFDTLVPGSIAMDCSGAQVGDNFIRSWSYDSVAPIYNFWPACPGAPPSELHTGDRALVTGPDSRRPVYSKASVKGDLIGELPGFEVVEVLEGPACAEGLVWWRVHWAAGSITGWAVEREDDTSANLMYER